ncbi:MAG: helix-turn-helix domain-containing protein [Rhizobiaceae bacterium]|nr:helix-turn-helix domain-containing protein [Rhizobiaceae bacterium]MBL4733077.1 helix-turn-helix domain-containing protein [Rhizobiaceae bacterium]
MGRPKKTAPGIGERLISLQYPGEKQGDFAQRIGVAVGTIGNYVRGDREPSTDFLLRLRNKTGVDLNWLLTGEGHEPAKPVQFVNNQHQDTGRRNAKNAPVLGLASCGLDGWARMDGSKFRAELPKSIENDPDAFAVISKGESMQPFGIYEGYLCYCSPATELLIGDIVCVERKGDDGEISLTIKKLGMIGHGAYEIIGYMPLKESLSAASHAKQSQELFWETVHIDDVERISVVTHIHTRPSAY